VLGTRPSEVLAPTEVHGNHARQAQGLLHSILAALHVEKPQGRPGHKALALGGIIGRFRLLPVL
jgi:hypothetical protein